MREGTVAAIQVRDDGGPEARVRVTAVRAGRSNGLGNRWGDKGHDVVTACAGRGTREASSWVDGAAGVRGWRSWRRAGPGGRGGRGASAGVSRGAGGNPGSASSAPCGSSGVTPTPVISHCGSGVRLSRGHM